MEWWGERGLCDGWAGRAGSMSKAEHKARTEEDKNGCICPFLPLFFDFHGHSTYKEIILEIPFLA